MEPAGGDIERILRHFGLDPDRFLRDLDRSLDQYKTGNGGRPQLAPSIEDLAREAWLLSSVNLGAARVRSGALLLAALAEPGLRRRLLDASPALKAIDRRPPWSRTSPPSSPARPRTARSSASGGRRARAARGRARAAGGRPRRPWTSSPSTSRRDARERAHRSRARPRPGDPPDHRHPHPPPAEQPDPHRRGRRRQDGGGGGLRPAHRRRRRAAAAAERHRCARSISVCCRPAPA